MNPVVQLQKFGVVLFHIMPVKLTDIIAIGFGFLFCFFFKNKRRYIERNLEHIFSTESISRERMNFFLKRTFANFALTMTDFFRLAFISKDSILESAECLGYENVEKALAQHKGCILITLHLGNWDYAGVYLAARGLPMTALVEVTDNAMFDLYTKHRESTGMKTYPVTRAGYAFLDIIRNNRVLAVLADRDIMKNGISVRFFSGKRNIPKGLAEMVIRSKLPVVFAYMVLNPSSKRVRYLGVIKSPIIFNGDADAFNRLMVSEFEKFIRKYPDQWFVFHPEWIEQGANA